MLNVRIKIKKITTPHIVSLVRQWMNQWRQMLTL